MLQENMVAGCLLVDHAQLHSWPYVCIWAYVFACVTHGVLQVHMRVCFPMWQRVRARCACFYHADVTDVVCRYSETREMEVVRSHSFLKR